MEIVTLDESVGKRKDEYHAHTQMDPKNLIMQSNWSQRYDFLEEEEEGRIPSE
jgi:hypothetical protein